MDGNGSARNDLPAFVRDHIVHRQQGKRDAAHGIEGMPPNFGRPVVRHIESFQSFVTSASHVYRDYDEATKDSLDNARFMRNDCGLMECIESRQRAVALLNWHIEPEDEHSQEQKDLAARMTNILERIPRFTEYRYNLLHAIWYGKYAIQHRYRWQTIKGIRSIVPTSRGDERGWQPVNGDKIVFRVDDPTRLREGQYTNQMGIRVGARYAAGDYIHDRWKVEPTDRGMAYFLDQAERKLVAVHRHLIEDGAYEDALSAGSINGVGIRSRIYWDWVQKQESLGFLIEYLERSAGGIELWKYPAGNPQAKAEVEQAAKERSSGRNQMLVPIPAGDEGLQYGIEVIEPGMAGIDVLQSLLNDYFGHRIKRYILGQTLSSEAAATGLGSGVAELHLDTFLQIIHYDARNLEETITEELLRPLLKWNEPKHANINLRFIVDTEEQQAKEKLEAFHSAWEMGARIKESDVLATIGASVPAEDEMTLTNPAIQQAEMMAQMQQGGQNPMQMGMPGMAGGAQGQVPADISPEAMSEQLMQALNSADSMDDGRNETYVKEGEEWVERELPDHDTGDRHRYRKFDRRQKQLEQWITIGGESKDGKKHAGGTPVKVDGSGNIVAGPKGLKGRSMGSVDQYAKSVWNEDEHPRDDDGRFTDGDGHRQVTLRERAAAFKVPRGAKLAQPFPQEGVTVDQARSMTGREAAQVEKMVGELQDARVAYFERISDAEFRRVTDNGYLIDSNGERKDWEDWSLDQSRLDVWGSWDAANAAPEIEYGIDDEDDGTMSYGRLRQSLTRSLYAKFDESPHPRDEMGKFVKGYRIHDGEFTEKDLHDNHMSRLWADTGDTDEDRPRRGLSATETYDALLSYFTGSTGMSIGRSANFKNAHLVELEGDPSDDDAWEESEGEILLHPRRIVSSVPVRDSQFMKDLTEAINETWASHKDSRDNRFEYDFEHAEWREIERPRVEPDDYEEDDISYEELVEHYADRLAEGKETEDSIRELTYDRFVENVKHELQSRKDEDE